MQFYFPCSTYILGEDLFTAIHPVITIMVTESPLLFEFSNETHPLLVPGSNDKLHNRDQESDDKTNQKHDKHSSNLFHS